MNATRCKSDRGFSRSAAWIAAVVVMAVAATVSVSAFAQQGPWGHGGEMGMRSPWTSPPMLDLVGATAAQRTQIEQIMQAARTDLKSYRATGQSLHQQALTLLAQPTIDANAAEALRQQELALIDQVTRRELQARLDAANVLTAAQRQTLATHLQERQSLMQKQRAEREALRDGTQ